MKENDEGLYTVREAVAALLVELEDLEIDYIEDSVAYKYVKGEGQTVSVRMEEIPDFEVGEDITVLSDFEWIVLQIEMVGPQYLTIFLLDDDI